MTHQQHFVHPIGSAFSKLDVTNCYKSVTNLLQKFVTEFVTWYLHTLRDGTNQIGIALCQLVTEPRFVVVPRFLKTSGYSWDSKKRSTDTVWQGVRDLQLRNHFSRRPDGILTQTQNFLCLVMSQGVKSRFSKVLVETQQNGSTLNKYSPIHPPDELNSITSFIYCWAYEYTTLKR